MPTSATGIWTFNTLKSLGFTLLEVMVVVVIIGILASFAVIQIAPNDPAEQIYNEARRLQAVLRQQWEEAVLLGQQRGLRFQPQQYSVVQLSEDRKQWRGQSGQHALPSHTLKSSIQIELSVEGRPLELGDDTEQPQVLFLSSGEATEFELILRSSQTESSAYQINGQITGETALSALP